MAIIFGLDLCVCIENRFIEATIKSHCAGARSTRKGAREILWIDTLFSNVYY